MKYGKPKVPEQNNDSNTPNLASFENLGFTKNDLEWCQVSFKNWGNFLEDLRNGFIHIVNDSAERDVRLIQDNSKVCVKC